MREYNDERAATGRDSEAVSIRSGTSNEVGMTRRTFLGGVSRWGAVLAVFGLGPEAWMQAVSERGIISKAAAAGAARDRRLHPFPSDDTFNMPLGVNAWYAASTDPATTNVASRGGSMAVNNGWSHPISIATTSDPLHTISETHSSGIESYRSDENGQVSLQEHARSDATPASQADGHLHILVNNELVELFAGKRGSSTSLSAFRLVRNRLDHYAHAGGSNLLRNRAGTRAWGGSAIAGLIRKHEVETPDPHIPHALAIGLNYVPSNPTNNPQLGMNLFGSNGGPHGDPSSPLYNTRVMFPANDWDAHHYKDSTGSCRMGMRFALDPTIVTDAYLAAIENKWTRAVIRALRDYGCIVVDTAGVNVLYGEQGISTNYGGVNLERSLQDWAGTWGGFRHSQYLRRVAGAGPVHNPTESNWNTWRTNGEGWGGGAPRVPYSPPLSGDPNLAPPDTPRGIEVSGAWTLDGAA
jgi:hypothetical protein